MKTTQSPQVDKELAREHKSFDHNGVRPDDTQAAITKGDPLAAGNRKRIDAELKYSSTQDRMSGISPSTTRNGGRETFSSDSRNQDEIGLNPEPKLECLNKRKCEGGNAPLSEIGQPNVLDG